MKRIHVTFFISPTRYTTYDMSMFQLNRGSFIIKGTEIIGVTHYNEDLKIIFWKIKFLDVVRVEGLLQNTTEIEQEVTSDEGASSSLIYEFEVFYKTYDKPTFRN